MRITRGAFAAVVLVAGCATTQNNTSAASLHARDFVALSVGNHWVYKVTPADPSVPNPEVTIVDKDGEGYFVDNHGGRLAPRGDGVFDGSQRRFMIEEPVEEGHEWMAVPKDEPSAVERYKITSTSASAHVAAGNFDNCVEVEATQDKTINGTPLTLRATWTYAPGVGLVKFVQRVGPQKAEPQVVSSMELVSYELKPKG